MRPNKERVRYLLQSYIANTISKDEWEELKTYVKGEDNNDNLYTVIDELWEGIDLGKPLPIASEVIYRRILEDPGVLADPPQTVETRRTPAIHRLPWRLVGGVAALLCIAVTLFYFIRSDEEKRNVSHLAEENGAAHILPGGNIATLTLADGRVIKLNEAGIGNLTDEGGSRIVKSADGLISYETAGGVAAAGETAYNAINTPKGGEYRIILPDGTKVWLNAASSLRYPTSFTGNKREVELTGEAYFEVAKSNMRKSPFIVKTKNQTVEVLGTHFNINAYADSETVKTTLLEGRVKVSVMESGQQGGFHRMLNPNEQAATTWGSNQIQVTSVDPINAVAWKNGYFAFDNDNITDVMSTIARWYDIEVDYEGDTTGKVFGGTISRFESFEKLLQTIGLTGTIQFKIKGRRVTVMT